jgi:hypothetical protein
VTPPTCLSGKMAYPRPIEKLARHYNQGKRLRVRYYLCEECGWYHLGRGARIRIKIKRKVDDYETDTR